MREQLSPENPSWQMQSPGASQNPPSTAAHDRQDTQCDHHPRVGGRLWYGLAVFKKRVAIRQGSSLWTGSRTHHVEPRALLTASWGRGAGGAVGSRVLVALQTLYPSRQGAGEVPTAVVPVLTVAPWPDEARLALDAQCEVQSCVCLVPSGRERVSCGCDPWLSWCGLILYLKQLHWVIGHAL